MEKLQKLSNDLDMCDEVIMDILRMRCQIVQELIHYKQENGLSPIQPEQEQQQKKDIFTKKLADYEYQQSIMSIYDFIIDQSKRIQSHELFGQNIFLVGFMGAGKSTVSSYLKNTFSMDVIEMDEIIAKRNGMSISEIFELHGEQYFRNEETELLRECQNKKNQIISCGGGVAMRQVNVDEMRKSGTIVLLTASPETILERVQSSHDRPLLENNKTIEHITSLMQAREQAYQDAADIIVNTDGKSVFEICEEIVNKVQPLKIESTTA